MEADFLTTLSFLTIAKKNKDKAMKLVIAKIISMSEDSMSGIKRSRRESMVWIANNPKAIATNKIFLSFTLWYAINDKTQRMAANIPLANSNISAISPLSKASGLSSNAYACGKFGLINITRMHENKAITHFRFMSQLDL